MREGRDIAFPTLILCSVPRPGHFTPGEKTWYPWYTGDRVDLGAHLDDGSGKYGPKPGFELRTVQPIASYYAIYAIPALRGNVLLQNKIR
jgi:hypothetical protein